MAQRLLPLKQNARPDGPLIGQDLGWRSKLWATNDVGSQSRPKRTALRTITRTRNVEGECGSGWSIDGAFVGPQATDECELPARRPH